MLINDSPSLACPDPLVKEGRVCRFPFVLLSIQKLRSLHSFLASTKVQFFFLKLQVQALLEKALMARVKDYRERTVEDMEDDFNPHFQVSDLQTIHEAYQYILRKYVHKERKVANFLTAEQIRANHERRKSRAESRRNSNVSDVDMKDNEDDKEKSRYIYCECIAHVNGRFRSRMLENNSHSYSSGTLIFAICIGKSESTVFENGILLFTAKRNPRKRKSSKAKKNLKMRWLKM